MCDIKCFQKSNQVSPHKSCHDIPQTGQKVCYYMFSTPTSMAAARAQCQTFHGTLASPSDRTENELLSGFMANNSIQRIWLDGRESRVSWEDVVDSYTAWSQETLERIGQYDSCASLSQTHRFRWDRRKCAEKNAFICERAISESNPCNEPDHISCGDGNTCLIVHRTRTTWFDARQHCLDIGGRLVVINTRCVHAILAISVSIEACVYAGDLLTYFNWETNQPNSPSQTCIVKNSDKWMDRSCSEKYPFVCQVTNGAAPITSKQEEAVVRENTQISCRNGLVTGLACSAVVVALMVGSLSTKLYMAKFAKATPVLVETRMPSRTPSIAPSRRSDTSSKMSSTNGQLRPDFIRAMKYSSNSFSREHQMWA
ncbi:hypothetical protein NP493_204g01032 [Ridgeia piscesae]|uniref:C-type lectin domain-containing protein n=1 Tax=Ridgeia piscesae TaxID=27915 RepID=A0AAD9P0S4_RIDPI|nr:hypothetical protein NP493_204g01032 [Ridgeia piscesae]